MNPNNPQYKSFGIVRDKQGRPKIEGDPQKLPPEIATLMTPAERRDLRMWDGAFVRDAQGSKRARVIDANTVELVDDMVAGSYVLHDGKQYLFDRRFDAPAGTIINLN